MFLRGNQERFVSVVVMDGVFDRFRFSIFLKFSESRDGKKEGRENFLSHTPIKHIDTLQHRVREPRVARQVIIQMLKVHDSRLLDLSVLVLAHGCLTLFPGSCRYRGGRTSVLVVGGACRIRRSCWLLKALVSSFCRCTMYQVSSKKMKGEGRRGKKSDLPSQSQKGEMLSRKSMTSFLVAQSNLISPR